jgi:3-isopropylmalate dehydrogenase
MALEIAVLPGDGIGREVMAACLELLEAAQKVMRMPRLDCTTYAAGAQHYAASGEALPPAA